MDVCIYVCIKNYPFDYLKNLKQHVNAMPCQLENKAEYLRGKNKHLG